MALNQLRGLQPLASRPEDEDDGDGTARQSPNERNGVPPVGQRDPNKAYAMDSGRGAAPQRSPTFAELRQQGRARPAPTAMPQAPQVGRVGPAGSVGRFQAPGSQVRPEIQREVMAGLSRPSRYDAPMIQQQIQTMEGNLALKGDEGRRRIDETMAARGLYDSTETGREYANLERALGQQRTEFTSNLARDAANTYGADRAAALAAAMGYDTEDFARAMDTFSTNRDSTQIDRANELDTFAVNRDAGQTEFGNQLELDRMGEDRYRYDVDQMAREDQLGLARDLGFGGLDLERDRFGEDTRRFDVTSGEDRRRFDETFGEERRRFDTTTGLDRERLGETRRQFDAGQGLERDRMQQQEQLAREEMQLREKMQTGEFTQRDKERLDQIELERDRMAQDKDLDTRRIDVDERLANNQQLMQIFAALMPYLDQMRGGGNNTPPGNRPPPSGTPPGGESPTGEEGPRDDLDRPDNWDDMTPDERRRWIEENGG
jgi:hypothetical protein